MASEWYYIKNGQTKGPVTSRKLIELARSGELGRNDLVWRKGLEFWIAAKKIKKRLNYSRKRVVVSPPLSIQEYETIGFDSSKDGSPITETSLDLDSITQRKAPPSILFVTQAVQAMPPLPVKYDQLNTIKMPSLPSPEHSQNKFHLARSKPSNKTLYSNNRNLQSTTSLSYFNYCWLNYSRTHTISPLLTGIVLGLISAPPMSMLKPSIGTQAMWNISMFLLNNGLALFAIILLFSTIKFVLLKHRNIVKDQMSWISSFSCFFFTLSIAISITAFFESRSSSNGVLVSAIPNLKSYQDILLKKWAKTKKTVEFKLNQKTTEM